jgi:DNA-binding transcriptional LysR family regulator
METQLLEAFVAVANAGSFSVAAENIHLTQPAVSKRIARLEEQLDCRLFDRIGRNINLTEGGAALLPRALYLLQELDDTKQYIHDLSGIVAGKLRLAISHHIGLHRLPPVLKAFASKHPEVALDVDFMDSEIAYEEIRQGNFELAVITLAPVDHPEILSFPIWRDPFELVCARDHPLARSNVIEVNDLISHAAILPGLNTYTGQFIKELFDHKNTSLKATVVTNYLETIKMMVSVGLGWSMLPTTMIDDALTTFKCENLTLERRLGFIHHRDKTPSNASAAFIKLLQSYADPAA